MREATLNAWDAQFWLQLPLPLAEVGTRLNASQADYLDRLLELLEDAVALATALALARITARRGATEWLSQAMHEHLARPALGTRIRFLWEIERAFPGTSGWHFDAPAQGLAELFAIGRGQVPRVPRLRDALDALTTIRNDGAHRRLGGDKRRAFTRVVEHAVFNLIRENRGFQQRILFVGEVRITPDGRTEFTARSLNGPGITSYRRGHWQPAGAQRVLPARVYLGDTEALIDAEPFLVLRDERVFVLDQIQRSGPTLRHFHSRERLQEPPLDSWRASVGGTARAAHRPVTLAPSRSSPPASSAPEVKRRSHRSMGLALVGCAGALLLSVLLVSAWAMYGLTSEPSASREDRAIAGAPMMSSPRVEPARCRGRLSGLERADSLPQLFSGAPIRWGSRVSELEAACDDAPLAPAASCLRPILDLRSAPWLPGLPIPQRARSTLAFHSELGFFEVMAYSNARSGELLNAVQSQLGPPHRSEGPHRFWEYPQEAPTARVKVSPLAEGHREGRSAIKVVHLLISARYWAQRRVLCAR